MAKQKLWIGRHSVDQDLLVRDAALDNPASENPTFFSLSHLRPRTFSPKAVEKFIVEVTDETEFAEAEKRYKNRGKERVKRDKEDAKLADQAAVDQKEAILERHRAYLKKKDLPYEGVQESSLAVKGTSAQRRKTICHKCRHALEDRAGSRCLSCTCLVCFCGACGCGAAKKRVAK